MHYSCFVFTKEFPTDDVLYRALMPFNRYNNDGETKEYPEFFWDWFKVGGRYICIPFRDKYKLTDLQVLRIARKEMELSEIVDLLL